MKLELDSTTENQPNAAITAALAQQAAGFTVFKKETDCPVQLASIPRGVTVRSLERLQPAPASIRAAVVLLTLPDLHHYLASQTLEKRAGEEAFGALGSAGNPVIFADPKSATFTAYLDYHHRTEGRWLNHKASVTLAKSRELITWLEACANKNGIPQDAFADFLEENEADLSPAAAVMHSVAANFHAYKTEAFSSARTVANGDFEITHNHKTQGDKSVVVPPEFKIAVPIFERDKDLVELTIKLRYRVIDGKGVVFFMRLHQIDRILESEWNAKLDFLRNAVSNIATVYEGLPPSAPAPLSVE